MVKHLYKLAISAYKRTVSPLFGQNCRFSPSCSEYSAMAVDKYGFIRGISMSMFRILRCNRYFKGGYDPVK